MRLVDAIALNIFSSRVQAVCDEMGAVLRRAAFSPNIRDRLDFSCAVFDARGRLAAQAAHIPVHLGSMAYAMAGIVAGRTWAPGDMLLLNDPFLGGTHLPDITAVAPVHHDGALVGFVANRAHHADIGCDSPGSMPLSRTLDAEGLVIPPTVVVRAGTRDADALGAIVARTRSPQAALGDFSAQLSANTTGMQRLGELVAARGAGAFHAGLDALNDYAERLAGHALDGIPPGRYGFTDLLDDDGAGNGDLPVRVEVEIAGGRARVDFTGTAPQTPGNVNCPLSVTAAAVYYAFRCLMPEDTPACAGSLRPVDLHAPEGCLVNARRPAAVAAGNVETSTRIVDAVLGALAPALPERIPAASQGSMNNLALGARGDGGWDYYETMAGGMGAGPAGGGLDAVHSHMTNTRNTPVEALEMYYPLRVTRYQVRRGSGGAGRRRGGDGLVRELELLAPAHATLLTERRRHAPWGLAGGAPGAPGRNLLNGVELPGKVAVDLDAGDRLTVETPGGGGWGRP
jgi:N-methylhydantoinase B